MRAPYARNHFSAVLISFCLLLMLVFGFLIRRGYDSPAYWGGLALTCVVLLLFYSVYISVWRDVLYIRYGIGLFRKEIEIRDIKSMKISGNTSLLSWLYDPLSSEAVVIYTRDGRAAVIGSSDRKKLMEVLRRVMER